MKIICTGNPADGICKYIKGLYPDTMFISRSNGYDLSTVEGMDKFSALLPDYDVFINHSQLVPAAKAKLLRHANQAWTTGHVINIGTVIEFEKWEWIHPAVAEEKRQLRELSLTLLTEHFKTTHLIVGGLSSCDSDPLRLAPEQVALAIKWILESSSYIPLIYVDRISDELINNWISKKP